MTTESRSKAVRDRVRSVLEALRAEELEERVAPVKCSKHPDNDACGSTDYGAPRYAAPFEPER